MHTRVGALGPLAEPLPRSQASGQWFSRGACNLSAAKLAPHTARPWDAGGPVGVRRLGGPCGHTPALGERLGAATSLAADVTCPCGQSSALKEGHLASEGTQDTQGSGYLEFGGGAPRTRVWLPLAPEEGARAGAGGRAGSP